MRTLLPLVILTATANAQGTAVSPPIGLDLPGNAALSMPARWTEGTMQVLIEQTLLPVSLTGQTIHQIRLRRPAFTGEPAYAALQRTLRVSAAFTQIPASQMIQNLAANRPANLQVIAAPTAITLPATSANGPGDALGATLITIPLSTPLPVVPGNLFLEFETLDAPYGASADHWVDAFWTRNGTDSGLAVPVGNGGCGPGAPKLRWASATPPQLDGSATMEMTQAPPQSLAWTLVGFAPQARPISAGYFGFGGSLAGIGLTGCHQWTPLDGIASGTTSQLGTHSFIIAMPLSFVPLGARIGFQMAVLAPGANPAGIATSNGLIVVPGAIGIGPRCTTVLSPGTAAIAPWAPYRGLMPVLMLDF